VVRLQQIKIHLPREDIHINQRSTVGIRHAQLDPLLVELETTRLDVIVQQLKQHLDGICVGGLAPENRILLWLHFFLDFNVIPQDLKSFFLFFKKKILRVVDLKSERQ